MLNISLQSEYIFSILGFYFTNTFFTSVLVTLLLFIVSLFFYAGIKKEKKSFLVKAVEVLVFQVIQSCDRITQNREVTKKVFPLIATFFLLIATSNLLALVPGFLGTFFIQTSTARLAILRSPNSDLTSTLALAFVSVGMIQYFSWSLIGPRRFFQRFFDFSSPIGFVLGIFELLSEIIKIVSFSFRLFGNIFAGEVLLLIIAYLSPYFLPLPFMALEIFVGVIQAFIFAVLTLTFIKTSIPVSSEKKLELVLSSPKN